MKYTKKILGAEKRDYSNEVFYASLFEMLNNEKTLEEYTNKILSSLDKIDGKIHVVKRTLHNVDILTEHEDIEREIIEESETFKKVKETKKPYYLQGWTEESGEYYAGFPLNLKGKCVGALMIQNKQELKQRKEIYVALHMLVFGIRYFNLIEKERNMNIKDMVTGLYSEKFFYHNLETEQEKYTRSKTPLTLIMLEIEGFSEIANTYGYEEAEKILKHVGKVIEKQSRKYDMPARIEGGLFAILLSNSPEAGGIAVEQRITNFLEEKVEIEGKEVPIKYKLAHSEYQSYHTRESFFKEVYDKLDY